ncbi:MAG: thioredoxin family protein [Nannocystales bacterium]
MSNLLSLDPAAFARTLEAPPKGLLVLFSTPWCAPCKTYKPIVERVVASSEGKLELLLVNADTSADLATHYRVRSVPTLLCFADGELAGTQSGSMMEPQLRNVLRNIGLPA